MLSHQSTTNTPMIQLQPSTHTWTLKYPPKIQLFLWKAINEGLPTFTLLHKIHLTTSDLCPRCNLAPETAEHILLTCRFANETWDLLFHLHETEPSFLHQRPQPLNPSITVNQLLQLKQSKDATTSFCFTLWTLWLARNDPIYGRKHKPPSDIVKLENHMHQEYNWANSVLPSPLRGMTATTQDTTSHRMTRTIQDGWRPPETHWIKINTDDAARGHPGSIGGGFICRDSATSVIVAMDQPLGITTTLLAETWALLMALRTVTLYQWTKIYIETDSQTLFHFITQRAEPPWYLRDMIAEITNRLEAIPHHQILHNYREANQAADALANHSADNNQQGVLQTKIWKHTVPNFLKENVLNDTRGATFPRVIPFY